jgi:hypothetical protein
MSATEPTTGAIYQRDVSLLRPRGVYAVRMSDLLLPAIRYLPRNAAISGWILCLFECNRPGMLMYTT